ncbi:MULTISPECIES: sulfur carrier protein ThiS adenylyltransferase ThiF [Anaerococcus]|uniref:sulfur carrier protein ThiS adenylyltransferase ThiF n=1 Tax=Anaerococcus TaxID=165779 RepID=UPI000CF8CD2F|nr:MULTISPECIES: sulfur carrier protein ThiS adenylyltransferase ThiF [Anaerococcus]
MNLREEILQRQEPSVNKILEKASVSILGCGGLGSNIAMELSRCGVGNIHIYDFDKVEYSNLNRQNYGIDDLGKSKVEQTKKKIKEAIPYVNIYEHDIKINWDNLDVISQKTDIFIEAFDKKEMKSLVFDYFLGKKGKKLIIASGLSGLAGLEDIKIKQIDNVTMIGDFKTSPESGLYLPRVAVIASLEALYAVNTIIGEANGK